LSQKIACCGWDPGADDLGRKCLNVRHWWRYPQQSRNPRFSHFKNPN